MKRIWLLSLLHVSLLALTGCKREFDEPPVRQLNDGAKITIQAVKSRFDVNRPYKFSGDTNLYCVVIADEVSGNLYKDVYVRDASGAMHIKLMGSGGLFIGDSIRINLNNVSLNQDADLLQLDSVDVEKNVVKLASGLNPRPEEMSLEQLISFSLIEVESRLVKLSGVEFTEPGRNQPFANASTKAALQYTLQDCSGGKILLRTSGYSYFASRRTPAGHGSITAIVSRYYSTLQLVLRNPDELDMNGTLCPAINPTINPSVFLSKDFNDNNVLSGGWNTYNVSGSVHWSTSSKGGAPNPYCMISNFVSSTNLPCESWLISPPLTISAADNPVLTFRNACNYTGPPLTLLVSTDYSSGSPSSAAWAPINFIASTGGFTFVHSGSISLNAFKSNTTRFAFKYTGTNNSGSTWEVDDVMVKEE
jgi:hypothetical protein